MELNPLWDAGIVSAVQSRQKIWVEDRVQL